MPIDVDLVNLVKLALVLGPEPDLTQVPLVGQALVFELALAPYAGLALVSVVEKACRKTSEG